MNRRVISSVVLVFLLVLLPVTVLWAGGQKDKEGGEQTWLFRYGNQQPETHSRTISMLWFADQLEERSGGRIEVEVYHSGVLGTEKEMFEMTVTGALEGYRGAFYEQLNPQFNLYNVPFLFQTYEEMMHFNASQMAKDMCKKGSVQGIYMPAVGFTGFRSVITKDRQIVNPEDLKGLKMRSPGQAPILNFYRNFNANPQEMAFSEVYMALKQGVLDGADNSPTNILAAKLYEIAPYFTALNYMAGADPLMVNMEWYESLTPDLQQIFNDIAVEALQYWDKLEAKASLDAIKEISSAPGVEGINMSDLPDKAAVWEEGCKPLWQVFVDEGNFTWDDIERAQKIIAEVRG